MFVISEDKRTAEMFSEDNGIQPMTKVLLLKSLEHFLITRRNVHWSI